MGYEIDPRGVRAPRHHQTPFAHDAPRRPLRLPREIARRRSGAERLRRCARAVAAVAPVAQGRRKWVAVGAVVALVVAAAGLGIGLLARRNRSSAGQAKGDSGVASAPADLGSVPVRDLSTRDSVRDLSLRPADLLPAAKTAAPVSPAKSAPPAPKTAAPAAPAKTAAPAKSAAPTKTAAPATSSPPAATKATPHNDTK